MIRNGTILFRLWALFLITVISGCTELIGAGIGLQTGLQEVERQQLCYCGPDGRANWDKDKSSMLGSPNFNKLCGKSGIRFTMATKKPLPPTTVERLKVYKIVSHQKGHPDSVVKNETPSRPYIFVGTITFSKRWYHEATINMYFKEKLSEVGADAILEYHMYQDAAMQRKNSVTGEMLDVYKMSMEAKVIRFTD